MLIPPVVVVEEVAAVLHMKDAADEVVVGRVRTQQTLAVVVRLVYLHVLVLMDSPFVFFLMILVQKFLSYLYIPGQTSSMMSFNILNELV